MADVAQLIRALVCGSGGRGFDPHHSPHIVGLTGVSGPVYGIDCSFLKARMLQ